MIKISDSTSQDLEKVLVQQGIESRSLRIDANIG